jgi:serine/threonine protein kinase
MTPEQIERVFGRGRLKMVTGEHVEVFREAVAPGERRRYTKRFLNTTDGDFAHWTEREWRILARLIGHGIGCVPDVVQFDRGSIAGTQLVATYDAGVTIDQWATLLPLLRDGQLYRHAFEDCAHWWALAHHCLVALKEIHQLQLVHLDIKGDNVCVPLGPANFDPDAPGRKLYPIFGQLALIDFAFALVSRESLTSPLPIGWQREYDYQSPRLLQALEDGRNGDLRRTRELDWRCDMYSLAAMLKRYLPDEAMVHQPERATGWTRDRYDAAKALILTLRDHHDRDAPQLHPHQALIDATAARLREGDLARSLTAGWMLARDVSVAPMGASPLTPMTRLAPPLRVFLSPHDRWSTGTHAASVAPRETPPMLITQRSDPVRPEVRRSGARYATVAGAVLLAVGAAAAPAMFPDVARKVMEGAQIWFDGMVAKIDPAPSAAKAAKSQREEPPVKSAPVAESPPATAATPAQEPPASVAAANPAPDPQPAATDERVTEPTATRSAEASGAPNAHATRRLDTAPLPPSSRTNPKSMPSPNDAARAPGKRSPANAPAALAARSPKPSSATKPPPVPLAPPSRVASQSHRALPTANASPVRSSDEAVRVEPAQVAQAAAPASQATSTEPSAPPPSAPAQPIAPAIPTTSNDSKPAPAQNSNAAPAVASPPAVRRAPSDNRRAEIGFLSQLFQLARRTPAPIEDRRLQGTSPADQPSSAPPPQPPRQERLAAASPEVSAPPPARLIISLEAADAQSRASSPPSPPPPPVRYEPNPWRPEESRVAVPPAWNPAPRVLAPGQVMPAATADSASSSRASDNEFTAQARRTLSQAVPRSAVQAQSEIANVLRVAANANDPRQERAVIDAAQAVLVREDASGPGQVVASMEAKRYYGQALHAYWTRRNPAEALDLQLKAFGADPRDPEIAGNLAFLYLKVQPETARQLALHAIAVRGTRFRAGRLEDWNTYAIASALTGRDADARNAMYVTVALARNVEWNCKAAQNAIANYGERLREPVDAMLNRIYLQGRAHESPYCTWSPNWAVGARSY